MTPYLLVLAAYLAGSVPTSYLVGRFGHGVDLRQEGSGNLGATNTFRVLGWRAALPVMIVDVGKGWLPAGIFPLLDGDPSWTWALAYGGAAIVGHIFSVWVAFRGGKGVATSAGVFLAVAPRATLVALLVWLGVIGIFRIVSLASITAAVSLPVAVFMDPDAPGPELRWFTVGLALFVIWAHRANIGRLLKGREQRIGASRAERRDPPVAEEPRAEESLP